MHMHEYSPDALPHAVEMQKVMLEDAAQVEEVREFGSSTVLMLRRLAVAEAEPHKPLPPGSFDLTVSHNGRVAHHMTDGDADSRWMAQQHGSTWVQAELSNAELVGGVRLGMPPSDVSQYPKYLRVIGTDPHGVEHLLYDDSVAYPAAMSAAVNPAAPGPRLTWTPLMLSRVRLEQPRHEGDLQWAIYELELLTPVPDLGGSS